MLKDEVKKIKEAMPGYIITAQGGDAYSAARLLPWRQIQHGNRKSWMN